MCHVVGKRHHIDLTLTELPLHMRATEQHIGQSDEKQEASCLGKHKPRDWGHKPEQEQMT